MSGTTASTPDYCKLTQECTKAKLKDKIDVLLRSSTPLSIVPKSNFSDLFSLVAHLKTAAQVRNFPLETSFSFQKGFKLKCNSRMNSAGVGCPVSFILKELTYGRFRVGKARIDHNHEITSLDIDVGIENIGLGDEAWRGSKRGMLGDNETSTEEQAIDEEDGNEVDSGNDSDVEIITGSKIPSQATFSARSQKLVFRNHRDVLHEVAGLFIGPRIPFPTSSNRISIKNHDAFRIYAQASAQQNNFKLQVNNSTFRANLNRFRLNCSRNDSRFIGENRCNFKMSIISNRVRDGEKVWRVESETEHNKACLLSRGKVTELEVEVEAVRSRDEGRTSSKKHSRPISPHSDTMPLQKRPRLLPKPVAPQEKILQILVESIENIKVRGSKSTSLSIDQLSSFLYQISPGLSLHATLLHGSGGIRTREHLLNLISMSSTSLDYFLERLEIELGRIGMKVVQKITFKSKIAEIEESLKRKRKGNKIDA